MERRAGALAALGILFALSARAEIRIDVAAPGESLPGESPDGGFSSSPASGDTLMASFRLQGLFESDGKGVGEGMAASLTLVVEIRRAHKPFWSTGRVGIQAFTYRFRKDPLDDTFEVLNPGGTTATLGDRDALALYFQRVHEIVLGTRDAFEKDREYVVAVTAILKPMDIETMREWLSGDVSGGGSGIDDFLLGIPRFLYDASVKMAGLGDERAEGTSGRFRAWP